MSSLRRSEKITIFNGEGEKYVTPLKDGDIQLARECKGEGSKAPDFDPVSKNMGTHFRHLKVMPVPEWDFSGYWNRHQFSIGDRRTCDEILDNRDMIDYGFNFEKAKDRITSKTTQDLCVNFYESETYSLTDDKFLQKETLDGGNSRWFQIDKFNAQEHVELSSSTGEYYYVFNDLSKNHVKSFKFHDQAWVWWDNEKFNSDRVKWFPDSEFVVWTEVEDSPVKNSDYDGVVNYTEHRAWSKYGNQIVASKHPEYYSLNPGCGAAYTKAKQKGDPMENLVDHPGDLWVHKKGAGVKHTNRKIITANAHDKKHSLNLPNCGNNQCIDIINFNEAPTNISFDEKYNSGNNMTYHTTFTGEINDRYVSYTGAVNKHITVLNSDHAVLVKDDQSDETAYSTTDFTMFAANEFRTLLNGNQDFVNYTPVLDTKTATIKHTEYSNNFEFSQNGFPVNRMKILNGTDTAFGNDKKKEESSDTSYTFIPEELDKTTRNEFIITNGGIGDIDPPTPSGLSGEYVLEQAVNNFRFANGTNFPGSALNNIDIENGLGIVEGNNYTSFANGNLLANGENVFKITNDGIPNTNVRNAILIENDHNQQFISMHDGNQEIEVGSGNKIVKKSVPADPAIIISAVGELREYGRKRHIVCSPELDVFSKRAHLNSEYANMNCGSWDISATNIIGNASNINVTGDLTRILGKNIEIDAKMVKVMNIFAAGNYEGMFRGTFDGVASYEGAFYSLYWPPENAGIPNERKTAFEKVGTRLKPGKDHDAVIADIPQHKQNIELDLGIIPTVTKALRTMFDKFISLELKFLQDIKSLKRN